MLLHLDGSRGRVSAMTDNQKFALLVFALVLLALVVGAWFYVQGQTNAML